MGSEVFLPCMPFHEPIHPVIPQLRGNFDIALALTIEMFYLVCGKKCPFKRTIKCRRIRSMNMRSKNLKLIVLKNSSI